MRNLLMLFWVAAAAPLLAAPQLRTVCASGCDFSNLQTAVNAAINYQSQTACEEFILQLRAGESFSGAIRMGNKSCNRYIRLRSSRWAELPADQRVTPADAPKLAKLAGGVPGDGSATVSLEDGTGYWAFEGLEITSPVTVGSAFRYVLLDIGNYQNTVTRLDQVPHHVVVDRNYIHGNPGQDGPARCVAVHSRNTQVTNSYLEECKSTIGDSQAIWFGHGFGPTLVRNNHLEGAGENILSGGGGPSGGSEIYVPGFSQRDMRFHGNHFPKRPEWKLTQAASNPTAGPCLLGELWKNTATGQAYQCTAATGTWNAVPGDPPRYIVKNTFELKDGEGVEAMGNHLEASWAAQQTGQGFMVNQSTEEQRYTVRDVRIRYNRANNVNVALTVNAYPRGLLHPAVIIPTQFHFLDNLYTNLAAPYLRPTPLAARLVNYSEVHDLWVRNNTLVSYPGAGGYNLIAPLSTNLNLFRGWNTFSENIFDRGNPPESYTFGIYSSHCIFNGTLAMAGGYVEFRRNIFVDSAPQGDTCNGGSGPKFDSTTVQTGTLDNVLTDIAAGNLAVKPSFTQGIGTGTLGQNLGADVAMVQSATAGAINGQYNPFFDTKVRGVLPTQTGATVHFTAADQNACTVQLSTVPTFASTAGSVSLTRVGRSGRATVTGLAANTLYFVRLQCGAFRNDSKFRTLP